MNDLASLPADLVAPTPDEIRGLRRSVGLSQAAMAGAAYVSLNGYQKWEQGEREMPVATWELLLIRAGVRSPAPLAR